MGAFSGMLATLRSVWGVAVDAVEGFNRDDGPAMAGYIAFAGFLSLFPFAIFLSALSGILIGPAESEAVIEALFELAPPHIAQTLAPVVEEVIGQDRGGVLTLSGLGAIWAASNAVEAIRTAFDRAYNAPVPRSFLRRRLNAVLFVLLAGVTFIVLGFLIIVAPLAVRLAEDLTGFTPPHGLTALRYGVGLACFALFLYVLNRWLPSRAPRGRMVAPGIVVTTVLWLLGASLFSVYLAFAPSYTLTYGAFAGVIVTLLFFYLTGAVLIFGAEVNAALLARRAAAEDLRGEGETWP